MHQLINKKKIYFYLVTLIFLSTISNINFKEKINNKFVIKKINLVTNKEQIKDVILKNIDYLYDKNILFINKNILIDKLNNLNFVEDINIKKKYPSDLFVEANQTDLIALTYINENKYFVGRNGKFIKSELLYKENIFLPIIFGRFDAEDFIYLRSILIKKKINPEKIIKYYYHKNKRWDLYFENNILLKLPSNDLITAIDNYNKFQKLNNINPNTEVDLRIKDRIILK